MLKYFRYNKTFPSGGKKDEIMPCLKSTTQNWSQIPYDIAEALFRDYVDIESLLACTEVCLRWRDLAYEAIQRTDKGKPALNRALRQGNLKKVQILLTAGMDVNQELGIKKWTPLQVASFYGRTEVVKFLLASGADVNKVCGKHRWAKGWVGN